MTQKELEQLIELLPPGRLKDELRVGCLGTLTTLTAQAVMIPPKLEPYLSLSNDEMTVKRQPLSSTPSGGQATAGSLEKPPDPQAVALVERLVNWTGGEPTRWKRVHAALLRIYAPVWERVDARDILVAWAAAWLALTQAKHELTRLEDLRRPLTSHERDAKGGRQADVSFWGRLADRLAVQLPVALTEDIEAARVLNTLVSGKQEASE